MQLLTHVSIFAAYLILGNVVVASYKPVCSKPRVRTEWRDIPDAQKRAYIDAIKCLTKLPHEPDVRATGITPNVSAINPDSSRYDDLVYVHADVADRNHITGTFLSWHRWYLWRLEHELRIKCGYKYALPFWDWSRDAQRGLPNSPVFSSNSTHGLGTLGTSSNNYVATSGAFENTTLSYPFPHVLAKRNFTRYPYAIPIPPVNFSNPDLAAEDTITPEKVQAVVDSKPGNYTAMAYLIDGITLEGMHSAVHFSVGGDLGPVLWSPNDPLFWLHHGNIDCIWARWQARHPANQYAIEGGTNQDFVNYDHYPVGVGPAVTLETELLTGGLSPVVRVRDVMYTMSKQLCYREHVFSGYMREDRR